MVQGLSVEDTDGALAISPQHYHSQVYQPNSFQLQALATLHLELPGPQARGVGEKPPLPNSPQTMSDGSW